MNNNNNTKGPPARLLARLGNPNPHLTTSSTINNKITQDSPSIPVVTVPEPTEAEIMQWIYRNYAWRCAICCEYQPLANPNPAIQKYAYSAVQRLSYQKRCLEARIPPTNTPPLPPSIIPPPIDEECLFTQICRDCGANGLKPVPGLPKPIPNSPQNSEENILQPHPNPDFHRQINFPLLKQLLKISFGGNENVVTAYLQSHGIVNEQDILRIIESSVPLLPTNDEDTVVVGGEGFGGLGEGLTPTTIDKITNNSSSIAPHLWLSGIPGPVLRQPRWGIQYRHPVTCIGYSLHMLGHDDSPLRYYDELTDDEKNEAKDNAEAEIMLSGPTFVPSVPHYPQMHPERPDRLRSALGYLAATGLLPELYKVIPRYATPAEVRLGCEPAHFATIMQLHTALLNEIGRSTDGSNNPRKALQLGDTYINSQTYDSAMYALGTTIEVARAIASGQAGRGLAIVRPPGHHADCSHTQGFCIFNNLGTAVKVILEEYGSDEVLDDTNLSSTDDNNDSSAALSTTVPAPLTAESLDISRLRLSPPSSSTDPSSASTAPSSSSSSSSSMINSSSSSTTNTTANNDTTLLLRSTKKNTIQRILIVDWDLHHGDGTEDMFYDNPNVLFISIHRYDRGAFYPSTGHANRVGIRQGEGFNINIPLDGVFYGDADYLTLFDYIVMPIARAFSPDFVFVSCGFDAARGDWLGDYDITPAGYAHMTYALSSLAQGKILIALEGGYNLYAIATSTEAITRVLLGENPLPLETYDDTANKVADEYLLNKNTTGGIDTSFSSTASSTSSGSSSSMGIVSASLHHGIGRRTPKPETWETIRTVISVQEKYWPVLTASRKALFSKTSGPHN